MVRSEVIMKLKHFLSITDLTSQEIVDVINVAAKLKKELKNDDTNEQYLAHKTMIMFFEKQSLRTRLSFETAMTQLGGHAIYLGASEVGIGDRESISDVAGVASGMGDILMARTYQHADVEEMANYSIVPVINGLTDLEHPCQALADFMTIKEEKGYLAGLHLSFVGDCDNNIVHSLCLGALLLGMKFTCASPKGYSLTPKVAQKAHEIAHVAGGYFEQGTDPYGAVKGADIVYTDTWVSMGDEKEKETRLKMFQPYQVTEKLMKSAKPNAIFMHDMPAYRGLEVTEEVIDGPQSVIFDQAHNRLHAQKALILKLLNVL